MKKKKEIEEYNLQNIVKSGTIGITFTQLAENLGMTPDKLRDERLKNPELDEALKVYEFNANQYYMEKMMKAAVSNIKGFAAEVYFEVYKYLADKQKSY